MKRTTFLMVMIIMAFRGASQNIPLDSTWQINVAAGIHSIYAPVENLKWEGSKLATSAGIDKLLGNNQRFSLGLQLQFLLNKYQGNALNVHLIGKYNFLIYKKLEISIGTGAGYGWSFYPSKSLAWNGQAWDKGKNTKGMFEVPLQLGLGYKSLKINSFEMTPYLAYHLQVMFGYSPDFSPLPESAFWAGIKFKKLNK